MTYFSPLAVRTVTRGVSDCALRPNSSRTPAYWSLLATAKLSFLPSSRKVLATLITLEPSSATFQNHGDGDAQRRLKAAAAPTCSSSSWSLWGSTCSRGRSRPPAGLCPTADPCCLPSWPDRFRNWRTHDRVTTAERFAVQLMTERSSLRD